MPIRADTLVFTIALNGYQHLYRQHLIGHQDYALYQGYDYVAVTQPAITAMGMECAWLKLVLLKQALALGYSRVLYVDADACINPATPSLDLLTRAGKWLYLARGFSGRFNSGVILALNKPEIVRGLSQLIARCETSVAKEDDVGWGENGHVIAFAKTKDYVEALDSRWNNNYQPHLQDYIRHYSAGPLRAHFKPKTPNLMGYWAYRIATALYRRLSNKFKPNAKGLLSQLMNLSAQVLPLYSAYFAQQAFCNNGSMFSQNKNANCESEIQTPSKSPLKVAM